MTLNFILPTVLIIEAVMIAVQSYVFSAPRITVNDLSTRIDEIYLGVCSAYILINIIWILYFRKDGRRYTNWTRALRAIQGVGINAVGIIMIYSASTIENSPIDDGQRYEAKLIAGIIALVDSIYYFVSPTKSPPLQGMLTNPNSNVSDYRKAQNKNNLFSTQTGSTPPPIYFQSRITKSSRGQEPREILNASDLYRYQNIYSKKHSLSPSTCEMYIPRAHHTHIYDSRCRTTETTTTASAKTSCSNNDNNPSPPPPPPRQPPPIYNFYSGHQNKKYYPLTES